MTQRTINIPDTETTVAARFIDQTEPDWAEKRNTREVLADWITKENNAYFARTGANRIWSHLFGIGLVDPPDGFDDSNAPSHPQLLEDLSAAFAAHDYDVKFLIRAITATETYQLSSRQTHPSQKDLQWLGRMPVKGLSPRQISDSLLQATGIHVEGSLRDRALNNGALDGNVAALFENSADSPVDPQTTILQALALMNGRFIVQHTQEGSSRTLAAVIQAPFLDTDQKLETLFLATLSRKPTRQELIRLQPFVTSGEDNQQGLADVFWALLNSSEFLFNH